MFIVPLIHDGSFGGKGFVYRELTEEGWWNRSNQGQGSELRIRRVLSVTAQRDFSRSFMSVAQIAELHANEVGRLYMDRTLWRVLPNPTGMDDLYAPVEVHSRVIMGGRRYRVWRGADYVTDASYVEAWYWMIRQSMIHTLEQTVSPEGAVQHKARQRCWITYLASITIGLFQITEEGWARGDRRVPRVIHSNHRLWLVK